MSLWGSEPDRMGSSCVELGKVARLAVCGG